MVSSGNNRPMDPRANTQVRAADRADEIIMEAFSTRADTVLFDPERLSGLAERAAEARADFQRREAEASWERAQSLRPSLRYYAHDGDADFDPDAPAEQGVVKIWRVGSSRVDVVRDRWHDGRNLDRVMNPAEEMASTLALDVEIDDYWCYGGDDNLRYWGDYERRCNVNIAYECTAPLSPDVNDYGGGTTRLLPVNRGTLVLLFRCCAACEVRAGQIAAKTYKKHVRDARADLPLGAVILPNPEPDVNPDAWG